MRKFPKKLQDNVWEFYLGRELKDEEKHIFSSLKTERFYNRMVDDLHNIAVDHELCIPGLPEYDGNCFFNSLQILGFCDDSDEFRKTLSLLLYEFKDHVGIWEDKTTLKTNFNNTNEIEYVYNEKEGIVYKYTYETMCTDVLNYSSWTRLPIQIIMVFLSKIFNIKFQIVHNNQHISVIDMTKGESKTTYYLGLLGEHHYIPLKQITIDEERINPPHYDKYLKRFREWTSSLEE